MENWQKILLIVIIIVIIISLDLIIYFKTNNLIEDTEQYLSKLENKLNENNLEQSKKASKNLNEKWKDHEKKLSFFIEHDEIEKVSDKIAVIHENTKNEEYHTALEDVKEAKYLLEHIKEKYNFNLKNIF